MSVNLVRDYCQRQRLEYKTLILTVLRLATCLRVSDLRQLETDL